MASSHTELVGSGKVWPPDDQRVSIRRMDIYRTMFNYSEPHLLARSDTWKSKPVETFTSPLLKMTALTYANLLFGEAVSISLGTDAGENSNLALARIMRDSKFRVLTYNAAINQSVEGKAYFKVRRGLRHSKSTKQQVFIETIQPQSVIRLTDPGSTEAIGYMIWTILHPPESPQTAFLKVETHYPGEIVHEIYRANGFKMLDDRATREQSPRHVFTGVIGDKVDYELVMGFRPDGMDANGVQKTGVDELLVQEVNNLETNGWSQPDLFGVENLIRLAEDRITRDAEILNKHASPKLAVPPGMLNENGEVNRTTFDGMTFEMGDSGLLVPQYITWEPRIKESMEYYDKVLSMFLAGTGLTHQVVGIESKSGFADSGTALRLRMIPTLARTGAKALHFQYALDSCVRLALEIADGYADYGQTSIGEGSVEVTFRDGIPDDPIETARVTQIRTSNGRTMSTASAVQLHNPNMSKSDVEAEVLQIREEDIVPEFGTPPRSPALITLDE